MIRCDLRKVLCLFERCSAMSGFRLNRNSFVLDRRVIATRRKMRNSVGSCKARTKPRQLRTFRQRHLLGKNLRTGRIVACLLSKSPAIRKRNYCKVRDQSWGDVTPSTSSRPNKTLMSIKIRSTVTILFAARPISPEREKKREKKANHLPHFRHSHPPEEAECPIVAAVRFSQNKEILESAWSETFVNVSAH